MQSTNIPVVNSVTAPSITGSLVLVTVPCRAPNLRSCFAAVQSHEANQGYQRCVFHYRIST